jgi:hypothetical protein
MTLFGVNIEQRTTATAKTTAGPSTSLRSAQDDTFWDGLAKNDYNRAFFGFVPLRMTTSVCFLLFLPRVV